QAVPFQHRIAFSKIIEKLWAKRPHQGFGVLLAPQEGARNGGSSNKRYWGVGDSTAAKTAQFSHDLTASK
ncbi:MAG: hypothetical protein ACE10K_09945, partial [Rhodothermales bacterium]